MKPKFTKSNRSGKKYSVITPSGKKIHFGATGYSQYKDTTGLGVYSHLNHLDKNRRKKYKMRHEKIRTQNGKLAYKDKEQPSYYAYHYLW